MYCPFSTSFKPASEHGMNNFWSSARSEGSEGTMSCLRVSREKTTQDVTVSS